MDVKIDGHRYVLEAIGGFRFSDDHFIAAKSCKNGVAMLEAAWACEMSVDEMVVWGKADRGELDQPEEKPATKAKPAKVKGLFE